MKKLLRYIFLATAVYLAYIGISLALMPPVSDLADKTGKPMGSENLWGQVRVSDI